MTDSTDRRTENDERSPKPSDAATEWQAPTLTVLGDAVPLTLGAAGTTPDGPGLQS